jgi:AcrR family transcriptional regulator
MTKRSRTASSSRSRRIGPTSSESEANSTHQPIPEKARWSKVRRATAPDFPAETVALFDWIEPESSRRLVISALEAFANRGFHAATTREIGGGAGMSPAAVYVHFTAKTDLLFEICRIGHQAAVAAIEVALATPSTDSTERVRGLVATLAEWHMTNNVLARVIQYEWESLSQGQFEEIVKLRRRCDELLRAELAAGVQDKSFVVSDLRGTANAVMSLCVDLARWYHPQANHPPEELAQLYGDLVIQMLRGATR